MISQVVMSRSNMVKIIETHNPYPEAREKLTMEELIEVLQEDIIMTPIQAEVVSPDSRRPGTATIAFQVAYENKNPAKAYAITNTMVSLYIEENLKMREEKTETTYTFLENQLAGLRNEIAELESEIKKFKDVNLQSLPELMELNLSTLDRLEKEIDYKKKYIQSLADRQVYLQGQLASVEPVKYTVSSGGARALTVEEELKELRSRYMAEKSSKSDSHPDVIRLRKQLEALEQEHNVKGSMREKSQELQDKRAQFAMLEKKYSDKHPDVIALQKEIGSLESELEDLSQQKTVLKQIEEEDPENPAYINLKTQIEQTKLEINAEKEALEELERKYDNFHRRIEQTPRVEQEYRMLQRDYQVAQQKYQESMAKLQAAKEAKGLEKSQAGEKLTIIDPPIMPEEPSKPNRLLILFIGLVLAGGFGVGSGSLAEVLDKTVRSREELSDISKAPVLAMIPVIETRQMKKSRRTKRLLVAAAVVLLIIGALAALHVFFRPLDILWLDITERLDRLLI